jgi:glycosyltransferase involved in cell wall biosynthesis
MKGENIVCLSWVMHDNVPLLMHSMMDILKRENRVLFVDPPFALTTFLFHPALHPKLRTQWRNWRSGVRRIEENFYLYTPPPLFLQYGIFEANDRLNRRFVEGALKRTLVETGFEDHILWVYAPYLVEPTPGLGSRLVVYGCHDEVSAFVNPERRKRGLARLEREFVRNADIVFTTTRSLYEARLGSNARTYLFPPGVDIGLFERCRDDDVSVPDDLERIGRPRIGFTGNIDNFRMNWDLINELSHRHPEWQQVLIGPCIEPVPARIRGLGNVHFLGRKPLAELPAYLKGMDVCYMPYIQGEWSRHAFPQKTFEYLACGKPVVTVTIPALEELREFISMADEAGAFIAALERAMAVCGDGVEERVEVARRNTWEERVRKTVEVIERIAGEKGIPIRGAREEVSP